jgi:DNA-binding PadR family transcriptional regulator
LYPYFAGKKMLDSQTGWRYYIRDGYMATQSTNETPLTPAVFHILMALADGERHGYGIMQSVAEETGSLFTMGPGTLYGTIKRMLEAGLIEEAGERPDPALNDERRRYYRITESGMRVASSEAKRLEMLVKMARNKALLGKTLGKAKGAEA